MRCMMLSIIIVNYNTRSLLENCLNSIYSSLPVREAEIIVVDNASSDGSLEMLSGKFPRVIVIANPENLGFSRANNKGIRMSRGKHVLLLNSDTEVVAGALDLMTEFLDKHSEADVCGCKLFWGDGRHQRSAQTFPTLSRELIHANPILKRLYGGKGSLSHKLLFLLLDLLKTRWASFMDYSQTAEVDVVTGAAFMFRRSLVEKIGLLDENYFMYSEEADYCYRIKKAGGRVYYYPDAHIIHFLGQTSKQEFKKGDWIPNDMLVERYKSMLYFFKKHYSKAKLSGLRLIILEAFTVRMGISYLKWLCYIDKREETKKVINLYKTIARLAIDCR